MMFISVVSVAGAPAACPSSAMVRAVALAAALVAAITPLAGAQDRMPPIPAERMTPAQRAAAAEFEAVRKAPLSGPFVPLLRSPEVLSRARAMGDYLRFSSVLPPRLSEFAILITARHWTQQYEWDVHAPLARQGGLSADIVAAIAESRRPTTMAADEAVVYDFYDELYRRQSISDATYARARETFGEAGIIDLCGISGYYSLLAMVLNTTRAPLPAGHAPGLPPFPQ